MSEKLIPIAISSQLDVTGEERIHAAKYEEIIRPVYVYIPADTLVYVVNTGANLVERFSVPGFVSQGTIAVSGGTRIAKNSDESRLYCAKQASDAIDIINTASNTVIDTIDTGDYADLDAPFGLAISPDDLYLYFTHVDSSSGDYSATKIRLSDKVVMGTCAFPADLGVGDLVVSPDGTKLYVATPTSNGVHRVDAATMVLEDTANFADDTVSVNLFTSLSDVDLLCTVVGAGVTVQTLKMLDPATLNEVYSVSLSPQQGNGLMYVLPDLTKMYVTGNINGAMSVVDLTQTPPVKTADIALPGGARPRCVTGNIEGTYVFVSDASLNNLYVIDATTDTVVNTLTTGAGGNGVVTI